MKEKNNTVTLTKKDVVFYCDECGNYIRCECGDCVIDTDNFCSNCGKKLIFKDVE